MNISIFKIYLLHNKINGLYFRKAKIDVETHNEKIQELSTQLVKDLKERDEKCLEVPNVIYYSAIDILMNKQIKMLTV